MNFLILIIFVHIRLGVLHLVTGTISRCGNETCNVKIIRIKYLHFYVSSFYYLTHS